MEVALAGWPASKVDEVGA